MCSYLISLITHIYSLIVSVAKCGYLIYWVHQCLHQYTGTFYCANETGYILDFAYYQSLYVIYNLLPVSVR